MKAVDAGAENGSEIVYVAEESFGIAIVVGADIEIGVVPGTEMNFGIEGGTGVGIETVAGIGVEIVPEAEVATETVAGIEIGFEAELGPKERHKYYRVPAFGFPDRSEKHKVDLVCREERVSGACYGKMKMDFEFWGMLMLLIR